MSQSKVTHLALGLGVLTMVAGAVLTFVVKGPVEEHLAESTASQPLRKPGEPLPVLWTVPAFELESHRHEKVSDAALSGHVWIADFIFTRCTTICPVLSAHMMLVQRQLPQSELRFVSFSVDPSYDTPQVLAAYSQRWNRDETRWHLLSTSPESLRTVASGMKIAVAPSGDAENPVIHSGLFSLVDAKGQVRGVYDVAHKEGMDSLLADARELMNVKAPGQASDTAVASAEEGAGLYAGLGCAACHTQPKLGPPLGGLMGRVVPLEGGALQVADENYIRESLLNPGAKRVRGYEATMPSYEGHLSPRQVDSLMAFLKAMPGPTEVLTPEDAPQVVDVVCKMKVRARADALHVTHQGRDYYFCSEVCQKSFTTQPERYLEAPAR